MRKNKHNPINTYLTQSQSYANHFFLHIIILNFQNIIKSL